ncbi:MAG: MBL fold metallo-hydrolase [Gammaproteobacteria bacterium]|nr:MAG: MBL fold metallo-hydrolase [Gammaproteobacteria bacterium]
METEGPKQTWKIGDVSITRVVETMSLISPQMLYPKASLETLSDDLDWLQPHFLDSEGKILLSIHSFLVKSKGLRIIIDTCVGNDKKVPIPGWSGLKSRFLDHLATAGFPREKVDRVLCTHLHFDHVGWNTFLDNDQWKPTFPNARYLIGAAEWDFWGGKEDPFGANTNEEAIQPLLDANLVDLVETNHEINQEVRLIPTPGHTPGHVSVEIESQGQRAVITGDLFHHPLGFAHPDWEDIADVEGALAHKSRVEFMQRYGDGPTLVLGTHFASPTSGKIISDGDGYRFKV